MTLPTTVCAACGTENRADRRFCRACGSGLGAGCPVCGTVNDPGDRFCGSCGADLADPMAAGTAGTAPAVAARTGSTAARPPDPEGFGGGPGPATERRLVSVLFADLVGSTTLAEGRDPELVRDLLSRYYETARTIVGRYGGAIEKFIGDAVAATWGVPVAHEDDAERAVRAALELVDAVAAIDTGPDVAPLVVRTAVMTGDVAASLGASSEGYVSGDLMNSASRLQGAADGGTVLVDEVTARASDAAIAYERVPDVAVRGRSEPIAASQAVRVVAGRGGAKRTARLEAPFVGRDDESRLLKELFHATTRDRRARLVSILGIAGIGKSRLAWELEKYIDGLVEGVYWHAGRSPAYGDGLAFWALAEMVRGRAGIKEGDDPSTVADRLAAMLDRWLPDTEERTWVGPRVAALLGIGEMPAGGTDELFAAWRTVFERMADSGTTVMLFEDVHWADDGLLEFIERLVAMNRARPILVITLARPELLDRRPTWGAGIRNLTTIELGPIDAESMDVLLLGLAPGLPPEAIRSIRERAEGVPLYAVEMVRMLIDQGRVTQTDGRFRLVGPISDLAIPPSLTALLGARLDALPDDERTVIGHVAVLGQTATVTALAAISGRDTDVTRSLLDLLVHRDLLGVENDPRSPERGQYGFVQGLLREVAYGRLSRKDRLARHLAAAAYFEGLDEDLSGVVATHLLDAHRMADGAERDELAIRARAALIAAALRARELHAWKRAISYLEEAADTLGDGDERMAILEQIVETGALGAVDPKRLEPRAREVLAWRRTVGPASDLAQAERWAATCALFLGRTDEAVSMLVDAWERLRADTSLKTLLMGAELARCHLMAGHAGPALAVIEEILPTAEANGFDEVIAELFASKMWALAALGRSAEGEVIARGNLVFAQRGHHTNAWLRTTMNLSAYLLDVDPLECYAIARDGAEAARKLGYDEWAVSLSNNAADAAFHVGDWAAAEEFAKAYDPDISMNLFGAGLLEVAARIAAFRGHAGEADRLLGRVAQIIGDVQDPQSRFIEIYGRLYVAYASDSGAGVDAVLERLESISSIGTFAGDVDAPILLARILAAQGRTTDARAQLDRLPPLERRWSRSLSETALMAVEALIAALEGSDPIAAAAAMDGAADRFRAAVSIFSLGMTRMERALFIPDVAGAAEAAAEARAIFERLGASMLLRRLDAAGWNTAAPSSRSPASDEQATPTADPAVGRG